MLKSNFDMFYSEPSLKMNYTSSKKPGNINSAFCLDNEAELPQRYLDLKEKLILNSKGIEKGWDRLLKSFEEETKIIKELGPEVIPQVLFSKISENDGKFPDDLVQEIKKRGCVVVRNVVDSTVALKYKKDIQNYIASHSGQIVGFPGTILQIIIIHYFQKNAI